jgi:hypothetical protein
MRIELLKTESDWVDSSLGCYISVNNNLLDVVTPLNNPHEANSIDIPSSGNLRLVIRDMGRSDGYLGSISIPIHLLKPAASLCLPLFDSPNSDILIEIPQEIKSPRIYLAVNTGQSEISSYAEDNLFDYPNTSRISFSKEPEMFFRTSNFKSIQDTYYDSKKQDIIDILNIELDASKQELLKEKEKNASLQKKIDKLIENLKTNSERASTRENSLLDLVNEKEIQINKCLEINIELQNSLRKAEHEKKQLQEKKSNFEILEIQLTNLEAELNKHKDMLKISEKNREEVTNTLIEYSQLDSVNSSHSQKKKSYRTEDSSTSSKNLQDAHEKIFNTNEILNKGKILEEKINFSADHKNLNPGCSGLGPGDDYIKKIIQKSLKKDISMDKISRIRDCLYKVDGIELSLAICDDGLYVKNGNLLMTVNEYWNNDNKGIERKSISPLVPRRFLAALDKGIENDGHRQFKSSPIKNFLKSTESSQNRLKITSNHITPRKSPAISSKRTPK